MTKLYLGLVAALVTAHVCFDVSVAAGVLTLVAGVACCALVDAGAWLGRRVRGVPRGKGGA